MNCNFTIYYQTLVSKVNSSVTLKKIQETETETLTIRLCYV